LVVYYFYYRSGRWRKKAVVKYDSEGKMI
jgi:hypothetical protein